ncbi:MAG: M1 family aminopeptidase [Dehalococcoidia bacterium]
MTRILGPRDESRYFWREGEESESSLAALAAAPFALPGDRKQYLQDRNANVSHVKLTVRFDLDNKQVIGLAELTLSPIIDGVHRVELDSVDTAVNSVKLDGQGLDFAVTGKRLIVELPRQFDAGNDFTLAVDYVATPQRGIYFTGPDDGYPDKPVQIWTQGQDTDNHHWFPCIDEPKGRLTSEIIATVPADWTAVSNGRLVGESEDGGERTFHWLQDKPHATYLITLAAGKLSRVVLQDQDPVIDFYCEPGREEDGRRAFGNTPAMIKLYEELFGEPYPWDKYTQVAVQDFIFGGMENTSATTQTDLTLHDERAHLDFSSDFLVSHEAVHQWFGDLLTCREWAHGWLNEGFATYFEAVWNQHHLGEDEYLYEILMMSRGYQSERYQRPIVQRTYNRPVDIFDRHLYEKGGLVLHMLRRELGDKLFFKTVRHYVQKHKGTNVLTVDLQRAVEEVTGRNLDWFFDQWVFSSGHPNFKVSYSWDEDTKLATVNVRQSQNAAFRANVDVAFETSEGRQVFRAKLTEKEHALTYVLKDRPKMVQFDPGYSVVKSLDFTKSKDLLIYQLENDSDVVGRVEAAQGLAKQTSPDAIEALKKAVNGDTFWGVQVTAARALGDIRTEAARDALIESAGVEHPKARRGVAEALGNFKDERAADALSDLIRDDPSYYVASTAAASLGKTKADKAYGVLLGALDRDSHMEAIRAGALSGLAELRTTDRSDEAREVASGWSEYGRPQRAREAAVAALGRLSDEKDDRSVEHLVDLLDDRWYRVRLYAVGALQRLKAPAAIPALQRLVDRELDGRIIRSAREAIKGIREGKSAPDDVNKLRDDLSKLEDENRGLKERLEKLEQGLDRVGGSNGAGATTNQPAEAKAEAAKK